MSVVYDPILDRIKQGASGGAGGGWTANVDTFVDLPPYSSVIGQYYMVDNEIKVGAWYNPFAVTYSAGIYKAMATKWHYVGIDVDAIPTEYDYYVTPGDWDDLVQALEGGSYTTVFIPNSTYLCTDNEANPILVHANVKRISGESRDSVILDFDGLTNTSITVAIQLHDTCVLENMTFTRFPTVSVQTAFIMGAYTGNFLFPATISKLYNILVNNPVGTAAWYRRSVKHCSVHGAEFDLNNLMNATWVCSGLHDINIKDPVAWGDESSYRINNIQVHNTTNVRFSIGLLNSTHVSNAVVYKASTGFNSCYRVVNAFNYDVTTAVSGGMVFSNIDNYACTTGFANTSYIDTDSVYQHAVTTEYSNCTFNNVYRDNTDNTKTLTENYSLLTAARTQKHPDKDGTYAMLNVDIEVKTVDYTMLGFEEIIFIDASSSNVAVKLPNPLTFKGIKFKIKVIDKTNTAKVTRFSSEKIEDIAGDYVFASKYDCIELVSDGTNWWRVD